MEALVVFFEQGSPPPYVAEDPAWAPAFRLDEVVTDPYPVPAQRRNPMRAEWDRALVGVMAFLKADPEHPDLVFALGKSHDQRIKPLLESFVLRYADDEAHEELLWQSLVALDNFDDAPADVFERVVEQASSGRARRLAEQRLDFAHFPD
ncbi:MAG: hypothetical protein MSC31_03555 [Solirubrobacteraceae bacterium MAG38_C4-C5]|nr:hypothetical protein [Candidatus Siliceabacter maunaloa]